MPELAKAYEPQQVEDRLYAKWQESGVFRADPKSAKPAYSIVMPPPNVTGKLTLGHVLNNTIQDILCPQGAHGRQGSPLAARHRPRRARHANRGRKASSATRKRKRATISPARNSSRASGNGKRSSAASSRSSSASSAPPATGRANASPWTTTTPAPCRKFSSSSTTKASSIAARAWSTGAPAPSPPSPTRKSSPPSKRAFSIT